VSYILPRLLQLPPGSEQEFALDRTERFYKIDQMLNTRGCVSRDSLLDELGISLATFKRDLEYMRERLNAPIVWDQDAGGYRFERPLREGPSYSLPGLWFNESEIYALLTMQHLLADLQPGLLDGHIAPLQSRLLALLGSADAEPEEVQRRFKVLHAGRRVGELPDFGVVAGAVLKRVRLKLRHYNRARNTYTEREVSPQQLVFYRGNWYLDAWCHLRQDLRSFGMDVIDHVELLEARARTVSAAELKAHFASGYGIFSGKRVQWAKLKFTPERARWVRTEQWHPEQKASDDSDGSYWLEVPFTDDRELLMDILKHGPEVEVVAPRMLRERLAALAAETVARYS
jgi:predicted DNA-binding transcriptional regulator YafY